MHRYSLEFLLIAYEGTVIIVRDFNNLGSMFKNPNWN
jgi:hypothetical protein